MTEYKYAAGKKSIICYDDKNQIIEKFEESTVSLVDLGYEKGYLRISGELKVKCYPDELKLYIKLNDRRYYPVLKKNEKLQFVLEEMIDIDKNDKLSIWVSYNHTEVKVNIAFVNKSFYKLGKYRLRVKKKEVVISSTVNDMKRTVKSLGRKILHR